MKNRVEVMDEDPHIRDPVAVAAYQLLHRWGRVVIFGNLRWTH